jgi:hypothetical protein
MALRNSVLSRLPMMTPMAMVSLYLSDPRVIFIKPEAHGVKKIAASRWRCIWNVSVVDTTIQSLLHSKQNKRDIADYKDGLITHQAAGMGHHDEGIAHLGRIFEEMSDHGTIELTDDDAEGWDISCRRDLVLFDTEVRIRLFRRAVAAFDKQTQEIVLDHKAFARGWVASLLAEGYCNSAHVLSVGETLYEARVFGITASGIISTTAQNCKGRSFQAKRCGMKRNLVQGDDLVHRGSQTERMRAKVRRCGTIIKDAHTALGSVSFTSHVFTRQEDGSWDARFDNFEKMMAHIDLRRKAGEPPADDVVAGCLFAVRHSPLQTSQCKAYVRLLGGNSAVEPRDTTACEDAFC